MNATGSCGFDGLDWGGAIESRGEWAVVSATVTRAESWEPVTGVEWGGCGPLAAEGWATGCGLRAVVTAVTAVRAAVRVAVRAAVNLAAAASPAAATRGAVGM